MSFEQPTEQPQAAPVAVDEELYAPSALSHATGSQCRFTEVWEESWPSLQDLEVSTLMLRRLSQQPQVDDLALLQDAGDSHAAARQRILEHLATRSPPPMPAFMRTASPEPTMHDDIDLSCSSPDPSRSLGPLPSPQLHFAPGRVPSSPSISSAGSSPKPSSGAFASVVRRASLLRPNAARTKSTNDAPTPPPAPLVSPALEASPTRVWEQPIRSRSAAPEVAGMGSQLDENRAPTPSSAAAGAPPPRKLRKSKPPPPSIPSIRTDSDYLAATRASYSPQLVYSPSGLSPVPPSSPTSQKRSWRRSFPLFSSAPLTPTAEYKEAELRRRERSPSPVGAFPSEVRRAAALPPVDSRRKKRTSTVSSSDSYLGDGEGSKPVGKKGSASSSTSSSIGMWGAFKSSNRKGSVKSDDEWDEELLDRSTSYEGLVVLSRPPVARSHSDPSVDLERPKKGLAGASASSSSLNLDKIEEQPEDPTVSRQPSLRNLIAQEENTTYSTSPPPSSFGTRTRTHSATTASLANTSRAPSPTRIISAKSSHSALARTITPEHTAHFHHPPASTTRVTPTPLDISSAPSSSALDDSNPSPTLEIPPHPLSSSTSTVDSAVPPTPELIRSRREVSTTSSSLLSRHALSGPSESDLSMRSGETTPWDASEGEDTPASSAEQDDDEDEVLSMSGMKELGRPVQVRVEGEGVVGW